MHFAVQMMNTSGILRANIEQLYSKNARRNIAVEEVLGTAITDAFRTCAVYYKCMLGKTNKGHRSG